MRTLIASIDSDIGEALHKAIPESHGTSRLGNGVVELDVLTTKMADFYVPHKYERLIWTIASDAGTSGIEVMNVNAVASFNWLDFMAKYILEDDAQVIVLSSQRGSIQEVTSYDTPYYRMSKAALNMGVKLLSKRWPAMHWILQHPGLVDTKMTKPYNYTGPKITAAESAAAIIKHADSNPNFGFYGIAGRRIPW